MQLVDIGANLTHDTFDEDRAEVIGRALEAGVGRMILTGASERGSSDACDLARAYPGSMYVTAGVHPHHASDYDDLVHRSIGELLAYPEVVAVGECGLDYYRNFSPADDQRQAFRRQLELAREHALPVFLHQRDAHEDFVAILRDLLPHIPRGVAHCFTGDGKALQEYLDMGLYIGITGWICDERRGAHLLQLVGDIPLERLMIETDAPYLLPRTLEPRPKSRRNEPMHLREVLRVLAAAMGRSEEEVAAATTANAERFFSLSA